MKKILRIREGVKIEDRFNPDHTNMVTELIQTLIPIGLRYVKEALDQEVKHLAEQRYDRQVLVAQA